MVNLCLRPPLYPSKPTQFVLLVHQAKSKIICLAKLFLFPVEPSRCHSVQNLINFRPVWNFLPNEFRKTKWETTIKGWTALFHTKPIWPHFFCFHGNFFLCSAGTKLIKFKSRLVRDFSLYFLKMNLRLKNQQLQVGQLSFKPWAWDSYPWMRPFHCPI